MRQSKYMGAALAGLCAGAVTGLFGAGGGMVLVPLLTLLTAADDASVFPTSVCIILPICIVTLVFTCFHGTVEIGAALPYLFGSAVGGILAGKFGRYIPVTWLHRILGVLILWGGWRYLC